MKKENRGGARKGAGRKKIDLSPEFKDDLRASLEKHEAATGASFTDMMVEMAFDKRQPLLARIALIKAIASTFTVKQSHQTIEKKEMLAVVMLPQVQAAPQMFVEGTGPVIDGETGEVLETAEGGKVGG